MTARSVASVLGTQPNTTALFYRKLRQLITDQLVLVEHEVFNGAGELDDSYFGGVHNGKGGRGARCVWSTQARRQGVRQAVENVGTTTLMPVIQRKIAPDSIVYTDSFGSYDVLDISQSYYVYINHSKEFARARNHIMASRTSGTRPSECCATTTGSKRTASRCSSKSASSASTMEPTNNNLRR